MSVTLLMNGASVDLHQLLPRNSWYNQTYEASHIIGTVPRKRKFNSLQRLRLPNPTGAVFNLSALSKDAVLETSRLGGSRRGWWGRARSVVEARYFTVLDIQFNIHLELEEIDFFTAKRLIQLAAKAAAKAQQKAHVLEELDTFYAPYVNGASVRDRVSALCFVVAELDKRVRKAAVLGKLGRDAGPVWSKIKKLRLRAAYETTPEPEKEICLRFAVQRMESLLPVDLLGSSLNMQSAFAMMQSGQTMAPPQPAASAPRATRTPRTRSAPVGPNELTPLAELMVTDYDPALVSVRPGTKRATVVYEPHGSLNFITLTGTFRSMRVYGPFVNQNTAPVVMTDPKGYMFVPMYQPNGGILRDTGNKIREDFELTI